VVHIGRRSLWIGAALLLLHTAALVALPEVVRRVAVSQIRAATAREVAIGDVDLNLFTGALAVKAFRLAERDRPDPFVTFDRLEGRVRILPLLVGHVRLAKLTLEAPIVRLLRTGPATFNFSDLLEPAPGKEPAGRAPAVDVTVERFRLRGGALIADDQVVAPARTWKAEQIALEVRDLSTRAGGPAGVVELALKLGATPIALKAENVRLAPVGARAALSVEGFDLSLLLPYLPPAAPASLASGRFGARLTLDYGSEKLRVDGDARLEDLVVLRSGQRTPFASLPTLTVSVTGVGRGTGGDLTLQKVVVAGAATVTDESVSPPARFDLRSVRVTVEDAAWPARRPTPVHVTAELAGGGRVEARGTAGLAPLAADLRLALGGIDLALFQPYAPIAARLSGKADGDLTVRATLEPALQASVRGRAGVTALALRDSDQPAVQLERAEATGLDIAWPSRVTVSRVVVRKPAAVIERDEQGALPIRSLLTARRDAGTATPVVATAPAPTPAPTAIPIGAGATRPPGGGLTIEVAEIVVEDGAARFVDRTVTPPFTEELSRLAVSLKGLSNAPGKRAQLLVQGVLGGASALDLRGEVAPLGETLYVDLAGELRDFVIPRTNPFLTRILAWIAREGRVSTKVRYRIEGDRLEATNEIVIGRLEVARAGEGDEVERRIGLPLGLIVALMKDTRGEIRVSVPLSGSLGAPEFSLAEAIWTALRNVVVNVLAAPFKLIGGLFTKGDRVEAVAIDPLRFEHGTATPTAAMGEHVRRVADFLTSSPFVRLTLTSVVTDADAASLRVQDVTARIQRAQRELGLKDFAAAATRVFKERFPDRPAPKTAEAIVAALAEDAPVPETASRALAARRIEVAREALKRAVDIPADRLVAGDLKSGSGDGRVELAITP